MSAVILNTVVTYVGLLAGRAGVVRFRSDVGVWAIADVVVLVLAMDLAMYVLHSFHAQHHAEPTHNFGFYTLLWDRLFGTLHPEYEARFKSS